VNKSKHQIKKASAPETRLGVSGHALDCLSKGDASACPICKPINDRLLPKVGSKSIDYSAINDAQAKFGIGPDKKQQELIERLRKEVPIGWFDRSPFMPESARKASEAPPAPQPKADAPAEVREFPSGKQTYAMWARGELSSPKHTQPAKAAQGMPPAETCSGMKGYRFLSQGETLQYGDQYLDPHNDHFCKWYPTKCAGRKVGVLNTTNLTYRRQEAAQ
jgi:hypothetical protein